MVMKINTERIVIQTNSIENEAIYNTEKKL